MSIHSKIVTILGVMAVVNCSRALAEITYPIDDFEREVFNQCLKSVKSKVKQIQEGKAQWVVDYDDLKRNLGCLKERSDFKISSLGISEDSIDEKHGAALTDQYCQNRKNVEGLALAIGENDNFSKTKRTHEYFLIEVPRKEFRDRAHFDNYVTEIKTKYGSSKDEFIETWKKQISACTPHAAEIKKLKQKAFDKIQCNFVKTLDDSRRSAEEEIMKNTYAELSEPGEKSVTYKAATLLYDLIDSVESSFDNIRRGDPSIIKANCVTSAQVAASETVLKMFGQKISALSKNGESEKDLKQVNEDLGNFILEMTNKKLIADVAGKSNR